MKRKLAYLLVIVVTAAAALAEEAEFSRFLLVFELLFLCVMAVWVRFLAHRLTISMELSETAIFREDCVKVRLFVQNPTCFPTGMIRAGLTVRDMSGWQTEEGGARKEISVCMGAGRRGRDCWETGIQPVHCGLLQIKLESVQIFDYTGVCRAKLRGPFAVRHVSVLPRIYSVQPALALQSGGGREGWQDQLAAKAGSDTQEVFDMRVYQRGDTLRNIHWKLSAKTDELMVKEFSMPTDEAVRIAADAGGVDCGVQPAVMDRFLENTAAFAALCLEQEHPCELLWYQAGEKRLCSRRVSRREDLWEALEELLGIRPYGAEEPFADMQEGGADEIWRIRPDGTAQQREQRIQVRLEGRDA